MVDWGTIFCQQKAYNTVADVIARISIFQENFVHARNANGRVAMGFMVIVLVLASTDAYLGQTKASIQ
jgi:hypothetical protein